MSTKCVKMCRNGDSFFPPVNVVVNPRDIRSMDAFLDRVTQVTRMRNAARKVCTPKKGHKIEDLTKLISGEIYVAVGQEAFKNLKYENIKIRRPVVRHREVKIEPVKHSRILMSARCCKVALWESSGLKTIHVYRNGDDKNPSHKILLDKRTLLSMDKVLELVTERVKLESGAVFALYTMHGKEVSMTTELVSGEKYVAVGHGKRFKRTAYNDNQKFSPNSSPQRAKVKYKVFVKKKGYTSFIRNEKQKNKAFTEKSIGNEVEGNSLSFQNPAKAKPATLHHQSVKKHIDIEGETSRENVFKASGVKSEKAKQVDDDKEVKIEKPIDQLPAEEVTEEIEEQSEEPQDQVRPSSDINDELVGSQKQ